jgi:Lrp/AsnC family transcriptional regulator for asnA, asnC and gidA
MISKTDKLILIELRKNARKPLAEISRNTGIPVSTIFDRLKKLEKNVVHKHTALIDYSKVNHNMIVNFIIKTDETEREKLKDFLESHKNVNSIYRITSGYDFMVECIFKDMKQIEDFNEELYNFKIKNKSQFHVIEELKKEEFLTKKEHFDF